MVKLAKIAVESLLPNNKDSPRPIISFVTSISEKGPTMFLRKMQSSLEEKGV